MKKFLLTTILSTLCITLFATDFPAKSKVIEDVVYKEVEGKKLLAELYLPDTTGTEPCPVVVFFHGGSWQHGNRKELMSCEWERQMLATILREGVAVVSVEYRLISATTPAPLYPAPLADCKDAVRWTRSVAERYGFDTNHIFSAGASAGAHLALLTSYTPDDFAQGDPKLARYSAATEKCIDIYGPANLRQQLYAGLPGFAVTLAKCFFSKNMINQRYLLLRGFTGYAKGHRRTRSQKTRQLSATEYAATAVPTLLLHGNTDGLVPHKQSTRLIKRLKKHRKPYELYTLEGLNHGFPHITQAQTDSLCQRVARFIKSE